MTNFKITRISEGKVFAKEVNPYGEKEPKYIPLVGGMEVLVDNERNRHFAERLSRWRVAEKYLQEYELTGESLWDQIWSSPDILGESNPCCCPIKIQYEVGQIITGEIIEENGIKKIRI